MYRMSKIYIVEIQTNVIFFILCRFILCFRYVILPLTPGYRECKDSLVKAQKFIFKIIDEHKTSYDEDNIRNIIDEYIKERNLRRSKGDPTAKYFTGDNQSVNHRLFLEAANAKCH